MMLPTSPKSSSSMPRIVAAGVPMRTPDATVGGRSSNGTVLRLTVSFDLVQPLLRVLARPLRAAQVELQQVRVGPAGEHVEPAGEQRLGERVRVRADLLLVVAERLGRAILKHVALRGDHVLERAALHPGEDRAVDGLRVLLAAEDEAGARAGERLVRGRRDDVAVLDRVRVQPGGDEPGEVRHVAPAAARRPRRRSRGTRRVDGARIGGAAADDQLRPVLAGQRADLVRSR